MAWQPILGLGLLIVEISRSYSDTPHSVGLLWTSDHLIAETSTWQHATLTTTHNTYNTQHSQQQTTLTTHNNTQHSQHNNTQHTTLTTHNTHNTQQHATLTTTHNTHNTQHSQHTTLTTDTHPCPRRDSNLQSQHASVRRPAPLDRAATGIGQFCLNDQLNSLSLTSW